MKMMDVPGHTFWFESGFDGVKLSGTEHKTNDGRLIKEIWKFGT